MFVTNAAGQPPTAPTYSAGFFRGSITATSSAVSGWLTPGLRKTCPVVACNDTCCHLTLPLTMPILRLEPCRSGGIGRRAGFKIQWLPL